MALVKLILFFESKKLCKLQYFFGFWVGGWGGGGEVWVGGEKKSGFPIRYGRLWVKFLTGKRGVGGYYYPGYWGGELFGSSYYKYNITEVSVFY